MPRGVKNTENVTAPVVEKVTRPRLTAGQKAQKAVDEAQKKYDVVATKLRSARAAAAALDGEARELKALLDYAKASPFLPKTEDPDAPVPMTDGDSAKTDPLEDGDELAEVDVDEEIAAAETRGDALTTAPADLPGADQLGDAEEYVASGDVVATDAQPEGGEEDPFAQYDRS